MDRKGPFLVGSHTEKATVLFCCVWEGFGPRLLSAAVEPHCGAGEAILSHWRARAKDEAKPREQALSSHGPTPFGGVKKIIVVHIEWKTHQSRRGVWPGLRERRVDVTRRGWTRTHVAYSVCVCVRWPHTSPDAWECIGFSWAVWEKTLSLSLFFYLILSQACGLFSCEHTASIKDLFISPSFGSLFASWCEKGSFTGACSLTPTHLNLSVSANWA